ncbi:acyltransferase family protein [Modestobacter sp. I12A-02628]|uniref:Acyltransferase n=1 Tax=Goekera deserti TaxID=2497753 RepID=A0A7K3WF87_9ACTN|nr:acyltransferase [Goekera deserti]MPQ97908.1 acyltransferase family protein [Goekera deserti]NDI48554.1 acyltransferase family protein [Goekera deserti]NEL55067.1 acyltransferase [Goekera deserti]
MHRATEDQDVSDSASRVLAHQGRSTALDVARGLAIVGVVFNHVVDGLIGASLLDEEAGLARANDALYLLRMPALMFLVGLFVPGGVRRHGVTGYLRRRVPLLVYLYVVWQLVEGSIEIATNDLRNGNTDPVDIVEIWLPLAHLWFLPLLAIATVVVVLLRPWRRDRIAVAVLVGLVLVTVLTWGRGTPVLGLRGMSLVGFLAVGAAIGLPRSTRWSAAPWWTWALVGTASTLPFLYLASGDVGPATVLQRMDATSQLQSAVAAACGVVSLLAVARLVSAVPLVRSAVAAAGRVTLPVYLAHVLVVASARIVLDHAGFQQPVAMVLVLVPLGVGVPWVLMSARSTLRLRWMFELPRPLARWTSPR